ncbi:PEP-CTERM sorting domain-containing protein [Aquabacterium sp.]|uniref:PEP-CTERM sorting domain-containing protein n=1 Tax=Aquabacterium sp. TaxID=1872578 RepID=UPI0019A68ECC|nr:PEP-CTERM sorting domain-containing protein [Aquabacterium sp.]MBC7700901.1 PEP-CTERM sorting domain-containing protein [Aquabacterium sp.]
MKFASKTILAAAAFIAAGAASAASGYVWNAGTGNGGLTFSSDALSALSASGSNIITATTIPSVPGLPGTGATNTAIYSKSTGNVSLAFNNATGVGDTLTTLQAAKSLVNIRRSVFNDDGSISQYNIYMAEFDVNLSNSTIYANLYSRTDAGTLVTYGKQAIFTADVAGVVGGTQGNIVVDSVSGGTAYGHASGSLAGSLRMNGTTATNILAALNLSTASNDPVAILVRTANWGTTSAAGTFTAPAAIPEPSTYALMGLGMVGIAGLRRRLTKA